MVEISPICCSLLLADTGDMRLLPDATSEERGGVYVPGFHDLVLFDGVCSLCNESVDFLIRNEPLERFLFTPQQDPAAARIFEVRACSHFSLESNWAHFVDGSLAIARRSAATHFRH